MTKTKVTRLYPVGEETILDGSKPPESGTHTPLAEYRPSPPEKAEHPDLKPNT